MQQHFYWYPSHWPTLDLLRVRIRDPKKKLRGIFTHFLFSLLPFQEIIFLTRESHLFRSGGSGFLAPSTFFAVQFGPGLRELKLEGLQISGTFPEWIGRIGSLTALYVFFFWLPRSSGLSLGPGFLPTYAFRSLKDNSLTGTIPAKLPSNLKRLYVNFFSIFFPAKLSLFFCLLWQRPFLE